MTDVASLFQLIGQLSVAKSGNGRWVLSIFILDMIVFVDKLSEGFFLFFCMSGFSKYVSKPNYVRLYISATSLKKQLSCFCQHVDNLAIQTKIQVQDLRFRLLIFLKVSQGQPCFRFRNHYKVLPQLDDNKQCLLPDMHHRSTTRVSG